MMRVSSEDWESMKTEDKNTSAKTKGQKHTKTDCEGMKARKRGDMEEAHRAGPEIS